MTPLILQHFGEDGQLEPFNSINHQKVASHFPNEDRYGMFYPVYRGLATNIYKTKDGRYYHIHGI
jgi:hypothetical protein